MVQFNELSISSDEQHLIIDVMVPNLSYYENVFIDKIFIDSQDTYTASGVSAHPIYSFTVPETFSDSFIKYEVIDPNEIVQVTTDHANTKRIRKELTISDFPNNAIQNTLFFVYVQVKGTPDPATPCGMDNVTEMGVVIDFAPIYRRTLSYLKCLEKTCGIPKDFVDMTLKVRGLELAVQTGNYVEAVKYWNKFFKNKGIGLDKVNCGCNG